MGIVPGHTTTPAARMAIVPCCLPWNKKQTSSLPAAGRLLFLKWTRQGVDEHAAKVGMFILNLCQSEHD